MEGTRRNNIGLTVVILMLLVMAACAPNQTYDKMYDIDSYSWQRGDSLRFDLEINDTTAVYDMYVTIRHNEKYPYSNLWVKLNTNYPDEKNGTIRRQIKLADNDELKWMGECMNNICSVKVPIVEDLHFSQIGKFSFFINHVMRTDPLPGVMNVGLQVKKQDVE